MSVVGKSEWQLVDRLAELEWLQEVVQAAAIDEPKGWEQRDVVQTPGSRVDS